jgi:outer membrane protein TolC
MSKFILILIAIIALHSLHILAQPRALQLELKDIITLAQSDAPDVLIAQTRLSNLYWGYQTFLADFKPQIVLESSNIPVLNRSIDVITLPDGSDAFINRSLIRNGLNASLQQNIAATGGTIFASTSIERIDIFSNNTTSYLSTPFAIGFSQPLFQFNEFRWEKQIQPLLYQEAQRNYSEDMEEVAFEAAGYFFQILNAQLGVAAAAKNKADADTLYQISKGRFQVGRIAETDLLQIELNVRNADANLARATLELQTATERTRDFLGIKDPIQFNLIPPYEIPDINIDAAKALEYANQYKSNIVSFQRRLLTAERVMAQAKGETGLNANIFGYFGLSQTGINLGDAYKDPLDQERLTVSLQVPIADWGKTKARLQTAQSNLALTKMQVDQDRINFERNILLKVQQFSLVRNQVILAASTYEVAQKRNDITRERYLIGKIGITDLNLALSELENARRSYIAALETFWMAYYELRLLTLYDFAENRPLIRTFEVDQE